MASPAAGAEIDGLTAELWPRAAYEVEGASAEAVTGFAFETQTGIDAIGGRTAGRFRRQVNTLSWVPPGCPVFSRSDEGGEYLVIRGTPALLAGQGSAARRPVNDIVDPEAVVAAHSLRRILISGEGDGVRHLHVLAAVLLGRLEEAGAASQWLTASRLGAIERCVDAHLHEPLSLARLATELDLSVGFLVRAFRQGVGTTPHRYVMERRLARARTLLAARHPVAQVAQECGFADQPHLTRALKRAIGVTPGACRAGGGAAPG